MFRDAPAADFKRLNSSALMTDGIGRYPYRFPINAWQQTLTKSTISLSTQNILHTLQTVVNS